MPQQAFRRWCPPFELDLAAVLQPLRRGPADPTWTADGGLIWLASTTADGPATLAVGREGGEVLARAWGPGADAVLDGLPALLGGLDDDSGFVPHHDLVRQVRRRMPGLRLAATGRVWDALLPAVLEQKVTGQEALRSWRELCRRFGSTPPGPAPDGMRVPPTPAELRAIPDWEWHRAGVDGARRRTLLASASVAHQLERAVTLRGRDGRQLLKRVPGIGTWTAAEVAQRAWADADAVSIGDYHLPSIIGWALVSRPLDDEGMLRELAPYTPQRHRAVCYIRAAGIRKPRHGPRMPVRDFRAV